MIKHFGKVALIALVAAATGCSSNGTPSAGETAGNDVVNSQELGTVDFAFTAVPGLNIDTISYDIVDATTAVTVQVGTANVSNADAQAQAYALLPPGSYIAHLSATGTSPCVGQTAVFVVTAGGSVTVSAALTCGTGAQIQKGSAFINATFNPSNTCGITKMFVGPLTQGNGSNVTMDGTATANSTFAWTSSNPVAGTLNNANTANASLTCSGLGGATTLTLTITDSNDIDCTDTQTVDVTCIPGGLCGNSTVNAPEQCDDGDASNNNACTTTCQNNVCGDTFVYTGVEGCDDGDTDNLDGCSNTCVVNFCGDNVVNNGEACDAGPSGSATCTAACVVIPPATCGNGMPNAGEQCDDGNTVDTDLCKNDCTLPLCGDGVVNGTEGCDDGDTSNTTAGCDSVCNGPVPPGGAFGCQSPAGQACQLANCGAETAACTTPECVAVVDCMFGAASNSCITSQPGVLPSGAQAPTYLDNCFCGPLLDANTCYLGNPQPTPVGACVNEFNAAMGPGTSGLSNLQKSQLFSSPALDIGKAAQLSYCSRYFCQAECGF